MDNKTSITITQEGSLIKLSGDLDGQGILGLETAMNADNIYILE